MFVRTRLVYFKFYVLLIFRFAFSYCSLNYSWIMYSKSYFLIKNNYCEGNFIGLLGGGLKLDPLCSLDYEINKNTTNGVKILIKN